VPLGIIGGGTASGIRFRNVRDGTRIRRAARHPFAGIAPAIGRVRNSISLAVESYIYLSRMKKSRHGQAETISRHSASYLSVYRVASACDSIILAKIGFLSVNNTLMFSF